MKKSLLSVFILLVIPFLSIRISFADEQEDWNKLIHIEEWNDAQKTECVQKLINKTLKSSKEFSDLTVKSENVKYHWHPISPSYSFATMDKFENIFVGWLYVRFDKKIALNKDTKEEKVIERSCDLDRSNVGSWENVFEIGLQHRVGEVIYSIPGTAKHRINISIGG